MRTAALRADDRQKPLDHYGIQVIVINGFEYPTGTPHLLAAALGDPRQTEWKLVYQNAQGMVLMRKPPPGVLPLNSLDALSSIEAQCGEHIRLVPEEPLCARHLGQLFDTIGDSGRARRWMAFNLDRRTAADPQAERIYQEMVLRVR